MTISTLCCIHYRRIGKLKMPSDLIFDRLMNGLYLGAYSLLWFGSRSFSEQSIEVEKYKFSEHTLTPFAKNRNDSIRITNHSRLCAIVGDNVWDFCQN